MKPWVFSLAVAVLVSTAGCKTQPAFQDPFLRPQIDWTPGLVLAIDEANRIRGNQSRLAGTARSYLDSTLKANHISPSEGIRLASGAEIHYLSGGKIIRMVMILKGNHLVLVKVNQVTSRYSLDEFEKIAGDLAGRL
jgi:hypothetical protein